MIDSQSMGADVTSSVVNVQNLDQGSIIVEWSGTSPVGEITVEARNGEQSNWYELDFNSTISISGNTGTHQVVFNSMPFTDIRLQYNRTSGTGTLDAVITAKSVGA